MEASDKKYLNFLVASLEVLFTPFRFPGGTGGARSLAGVNERRQQYRRREGIRLVVGGTTGDRQAGFQALRQLASDGFVKIHSGTVHRRGVSLVRVDAALSMTPNLRLAERWPILQRLADLRDDPNVVRQGELVFEGDVWETTDGRVVAGHEQDAWPLLMLGYLESYTDAVGRIGWRVTDSGLTALDAGPPAPDDMSAEYDSILATEYNRLVLEGLTERDNWLPQSRSEIQIPLSAGAWSRRADEDHNPATLATT